MGSIIEGTQVLFRSGNGGPKPGEMGFGLQEFHGLVSAPPAQTETGSSFTALLELPAPQAVELLVNSPDDAANEESPAKPSISGTEEVPSHFTPPPPIFPSDIGLIVRASKFSVFAAENPNNSNSLYSSSKKLDIVKQEPPDSSLNPYSSSPVALDHNQKQTKRKEREKKVQASNRKNKKVAPKEAPEDGGEKLPYVHVRARRGQATDSHSLAERARREKINGRMKLLQELVPGCSKISGTAMVLDEIINHVQALQRQVEFLSMRLAAANPRIDYNLDMLLASEAGSPVDGSFTGMFTPSLWPMQHNGNIEHYGQMWHFDGLHQPVLGREENNLNFATTGNSLLSYDDSSANSASLHSSQVKMV